MNLWFWRGIADSCGLKLRVGGNSLTLVAVSVLSNKGRGGVNRKLSGAGEGRHKTNNVCTMLDTIAAGRGRDDKFSDHSHVTEAPRPPGTSRNVTDLIKLFSRKTKSPAALQPNDRG